MFIVLLIAGLVLIILGFIVIILSYLAGAERKESVAGGVVVIGPIPIVFGSSIKAVKIVLVLAIILTILSILLTVLLLKVSL